MNGGKWLIYACTESVYKSQTYFSKYVRRWGETQVMVRYPKRWTDKEIRDLVYDFFTVQQE
jgi:hypothetical protein